MHNLKIRFFAILLLSTACESNGQYQLRFTLDDPTRSQNDLFGSYVAVDGDYVAVSAFGDSTLGKSAGQVHVFDRLTGMLNLTIDSPEQTAGDLFGSSIAMSGSMLLIGARGVDGVSQNSGRAYLYDVETGELLSVYDDPNNTGTDQFGISVALSENYALVGDNTDRDGFNSVGQVYLFDLVTNRNVQTYDIPIASGADRFGCSLAISGEQVLIGACQAVDNGVARGRAYLFDTAGNLLHELLDPNPTGDDDFGGAVAIDDNNLFVGSQGDSTFGGQGNVIQFDAKSGEFVKSFESPDGSSFGISVSASNGQLLVGADSTKVLTKIGFIRTGRAFLYDISSGNLIQAFDDPTGGQSDDQFGHSVALNDGTVVIGEQLDSTFGMDVGQAHVFEQLLLGDANCDGALNLLDVQPFIDLLSSGGYLDKADINQDGFVNLLDVDGFIELLSG